METKYFGPTERTTAETLKAGDFVRLIVPTRNRRGLTCETSLRDVERVGKKVRLIFWHLGSVVVEADRAVTVDRLL